MSRFYFGDSDDSGSDNEALPYPKPLVRSAFLTQDFSPTEFLSTLRNRHQTLEDLRQELRGRSQELNKELLDLVNNNYQDFLGLGDSLAGGEEKVEEVRLGLLEFRREIDTLQQTIGKRHAEVSQLIDQRRSVLKDHLLGRNLLEVDSRLSDLEEGLQLTSNGVGDDLSLDFLDSESDSDDDGTIPLQRLIHRTQQFKQVQRLVSKIGPTHPFLTKQDIRMSKIKQTLIMDLNYALTSIRSSSGRSENTEKIVKLLALYRDLGENTEALKIVKTK